MENAPILIIVILSFIILLVGAIMKNSHLIIGAGSAFLTAILVSFLSSEPDIDDDFVSRSELAKIKIEDHLNDKIKTLNAEITALNSKNDDLVIQFSKGSPTIKKTEGSDAISTTKTKRSSSELRLINESVEHNYKLMLARNLARKISAKAVNEDASAAWQYKKTTGFGMLISENVMGLFTTSKQLNDFTTAHIDSVSTKSQKIKSEQVETKLGTFVVTHMRVKLDGEKYYYIVCNLFRNGYHYQITSWAIDTPRINISILAKSNLAALNSLEQLDAEKVAIDLGADDAKDYTDESMGISLTADSSWSKYDLSDDSDSLPAYGANIKDDSFLLYTIFVPARYSNEDIISGYLDKFNLSDGLGEKKLKTRTVGKFSVQSVVADYEIDNDRFHSKLEIIRDGEKVALLRTWAWKKNKLLDQDKIWLRFKWNKEKGNSTEAKEWKNALSETVKKSSAILLNHLGIDQFEDNLLVKSLATFKEANNLDPKQESYIRNIIYTYREMGKNQLALKLTEKTLTSSSQPSAKLLNYHASILQTLGKTDEAQVAYLKLLANKEQDDEAMFDFLGLLSEVRRYELAVKVAKEYYADYPSIKTQRWVAFMYQRNSNFDAAEEVFKEVLLNQPNDVSATNGIIDLFIETEDYENANKFVAQWVKRSPENMAAKMKQIDVLIAANKKSEAFDYAQKLSSDHSDNNELKLKMAKLSSSLGLGDHSLITKKINSVELPKSLTKKISEQATNGDLSSDRDSLCLYRISSIHVHDSGEIRETVRQKYKILTKQGIEQHTKRTITFYPTSQSVFVNSLRVYDKSGKLSHQGEAVDYYITDKDKQMATHEKSVHLPLKSLEIGSTFELTYTTRTWKYKEMMNYKDYWFVMSQPTRIKAVTLTGDLSDIVWQASPKINETGGKNDTKIWLLEDLEEYRSEGFSPNRGEAYPRLAIGPAAIEWEHVSKGYYDHIKEKFNSRAELKELTATIIKKDASDEEKLEAIIQWVQSNITYQAIEFGPRGRMPKAARTTMQTKEGDCKDMSLLLSQMLNEAGIEAYMALAHTYEEVVKNVPSEDQFNHLVVYCPTLKNKVIDPTYNRLNLLRHTPYRLILNHVLPVTENGDQLYLVPRPEHADVKISTKRHLSADATHINLKETSLLSGYASSFYRGEIAGKNAKELIQYVTYLFSDSYPTLEITEVTINSGLKNNYTPLSITIHAKIPREKTNTKVPMLWESNYMRVSRDVDRKHPLKSSYKMLINSTTQVADGSMFVFEMGKFDNKYAQFYSKNLNGDVHLSSLRKRCSGTKDEFDLFRKQSNKLIPSITLP